MGINQEVRSEAEPRRKRAMKIVGRGSCALVVTGLLAGGLTAFSIYSQSITKTTNFAAGEWHVAVDGEKLIGESTTQHIGDVSGLAPGQSVFSQVEFSNLGDIAGVVDLDSIISTGELGEYLRVQGVAVTAATAGTFDYGECVQDYNENFVPASSWNFPAWVAPVEPATSATECEAGYETATLATASTFNDGATGMGYMLLLPGETIAVNFKTTLQETATIEQASGKSASSAAKFNVTQAPLFGDNVGIGNYKEALGTRDVYQP